MKPRTVVITLEVITDLPLDYLRQREIYAGERISVKQVHASVAQPSQPAYDNRKKK